MTNIYIYIYIYIYTHTTNLTMFFWIPIHFFPSFIFFEITFVLFYPKIYPFSLFTQPLRSGQDMTQGQFLSRV